MLGAKRPKVPKRDAAEAVLARKEWETQRKRRQREAKKAKPGSQPPSQTESSRQSDAPSVNG